MAYKIFYLTSKKKKIKQSYLAVLFNFLTVPIEKKNQELTFPLYTEATENNLTAEKKQQSFKRHAKRTWILKISFANHWNQEALLIFGVLI